MNSDFRTRLTNALRIYKADRRNGPLVVEIHFHDGEPSKAKIIEERRSGTLRILSEFEARIDEACLTALGSLM